MSVPEGIADGTLASLQVITLGDSGAALYNCADIRFSQSAQLSNCTNDGVTVTTVKEQKGDANSTDSADEKDGAKGDDKDGGAGLFGVNGALLTAVVGLTTAFAIGLGM